VAYPSMFTYPQLAHASPPSLRTPPPQPCNTLDRYLETRRGGCERVRAGLREREREREVELTIKK
jgi:hypothetical protein